MDTVLYPRLQVFPGMSPDINILVQIDTLLFLYVAVFTSRMLKIEFGGSHAPVYINMCKILNIAS